jgi:AbrB family looped-hinge helix DNA binding protein
MAKITSKLQVTLPKAIAQAHGLRPGDQIDWVSAGDVIRVVPGGRSAPSRNVAERLRLFDQATRRQQGRERGRKVATAGSRGWTREELYVRGRAR